MTPLAIPVDLAASLARRNTDAALALASCETLHLEFGAVALQVLVVYVPVLQRAFGTVALSGRDWLFCVAVASSVLWLREASKVLARQERTR